MRKKLGGENFIMEERDGAKRLRKSLQNRIQHQRSVAKAARP